MSHTHADAYDMLYFQCFENAYIAEREYADKYPGRRNFNGKVFKNLSTKIRVTWHIRLQRIIT